MTNLERLVAGSAMRDWQIAAECGIHPTAFSLYKGGKRKIPRSSAERLAAYFHVSTETLLENETPMAMPVDLP